MTFWELEENELKEMKILIESNVQWLNLIIVA